MPRSNEHSDSADSDHPRHRQITALPSNIPAKPLEETPNLLYTLPLDSEKTRRKTIQTNHIYGSMEGHEGSTD
jgi:hypothetical protein